MDNIISVDIEEWYHGFESHWLKMNPVAEPLVVKNTLKILDVFDKYHVQGTFFVLGEIAEQYPDLVREIDRRGHELALHGYKHIPVNELSEDGFRYQIEKSLAIMSMISNQKIIGFRAPHLSMNRQLWAYPVLFKFGLRYDSSLKYHSNLQCEDKRVFFRMPMFDDQGIFEFPVSTRKVFGLHVPFSGGTYFRVIPEFVIRKLIQSDNERDRAVHLYLHPREIEPKLPSLKLGFIDFLRYRGRLGNTLEKLEKLLKRFRFTSIKNYLKTYQFEISGDFKIYEQA